MLIGLACIGTQSFYNGLRSYAYRVVLTLGRAFRRARKSAEPGFLRHTLTGCGGWSPHLCSADIPLSAGLPRAADCPLPAGTRRASPQYCGAAARLDSRASSTPTSGSGSCPAHAIVLSRG